MHPNPSSTFIIIIILVFYLLKVDGSGHSPANGGNEEYVDSVSPLGTSAVAREAEFGVSSGNQQPRRNQLKLNELHGDLIGNIMQQMPFKDRAAMMKAVKGSRSEFHHQAAPLVAFKRRYRHASIDELMNLHVNPQRSTRDEKFIREMFEILPKEQISSSINSAAYYSEWYNVEAMLSYGADPNLLAYSIRWAIVRDADAWKEKLRRLVGNERFNQLSHFPESSRKRLKEYLERKGVNASIKDTGQMDTLLIEACENGEEDLAKLLIEFGADVHLASTSMLNVASKNHPGIIRLLFAHGVVNSAAHALKTAARDNSVDAIRELLHRFAFSKDELNWALFMAAVMQKKDATLLLISNGADYEHIFNLKNQKAANFIRSIINA